MKLDRHYFDNVVCILTVQTVYTFCKLCGVCGKKKINCEVNLYIIIIKLFFCERHSLACSCSIG